MSSTGAPLTPTAVSCPAKVLVAGGYLVLDRQHTGLVFGLDARIHTVVEPIKTKSGVTINEILVTSSQFREAIWEYGYRLQGGDAGIAVTQLSVGHEQSIAHSRNPFIETALTYCLTYIQTLQPNTLIQPSSIRILADQAYYSNPGVPRASEVISVPPHQTSRFLDFNVRLKDAHKTGLGSSAALVTSLTAAVLSFYLSKDLFDMKSNKGLMVLHNLAQVSHSHAQGKVGSGFDVASAVFGSCLYKRFSPSLLSSLPQPSTPGFATQLRELIEGSSWDAETKKSAIMMPKGLRLVMCDVDCGSETPGMVKKVLAWRSQSPEEADGIWKSLQGGNDALAAELTRLATEGEGDGEAKYDKLREIITSNRRLIRDMGEKSSVPIEPPQQTRLLDYCSKLDGVVGGVVPGAGGFDAIVLLVEDTDEAIASLKKALELYQDPEAMSRIGVIGVREEMVGVKEEQLSLYKEWSELL